MAALIWAVVLSTLVVLVVARGLLGHVGNLTANYAPTYRRADRDLLDSLEHRERRRLIRLAAGGKRIEDPDQKLKAAAACRIALAVLCASKNARRWSLPVIGVFVGVMFMPPPGHDARSWFLLGIAFNYAFLSLVALPALWKHQARRLTRTAEVNGWTLEPDAAPTPESQPREASRRPSSQPPASEPDHCRNLPSEFPRKTLGQIPELRDNVLLVAADYESWVTVFECSKCEQRWRETYEGKGRRATPQLRKV